MNANNKFETARLLCDRISRFSGINLSANQQPPVLPDQFNLQLGFAVVNATFPRFIEADNKEVIDARSYFDNYGKVSYFQIERLNEQDKFNIIRNAGNVLQRAFLAYDMRGDITQFGPQTPPDEIMRLGYTDANGEFDTDYVAWIQFYQPERRGEIQQDNQDGYDLLHPQAAFNQDENEDAQGDNILQIQRIPPGPIGPLVHPEIPRSIFNDESDSESNSDESDISGAERRVARKANVDAGVQILRGRVVPKDELRVRCWYVNAYQVPELPDIPPILEVIKVMDNSSSYDFFANFSNGIANGVFQECNYKAFCTMLVNYTWNYAVSRRLGYFNNILMKHPVGQRPRPRELQATRAQLEQRPNGELYWKLYAVWTAIRVQNDRTLKEYVEPLTGALAAYVGLFEAGPHAQPNLESNVAYEMVDRRINYVDLRYACGSLKYDEMAEYPEDNLDSFAIIISALMVTMGNTREIITTPDGHERYNRWLLYEMKEVTTKSPIRMQWKAAALILSVVFSMLRLE